MPIKLIFALKLIPIVGLGTTLQFVGIELDSVRQEARLPLDKLTKCRTLLNHFLKKRSVTLRELQIKLNRENSAKCVNQTDNFYFRPKLKTAISPPSFNTFKNSFLDESSCLDLYINLKFKISTKWSV